MNFKEMKEKLFGKPLDLIKENIQRDENFFKKEVDVIKLCVDAGICADDIFSMDKDFPALYLFRKRYIVMMYIWKNFTNIEMIPEDEAFEDYDIFVEKAILGLNRNAYLFKNLVDEIIEEKQNRVIDELYDVLSKGLPTTEDITKMKKELDNMFSDESPEKLQKIENILAYNDPNIKQIKDFIFNPKLLTKKEEQKSVNKEVKNNDEEKVIEIAKDTKESADKVAKLINGTPMAKEVNERIKQEQINRVLEYNKELEQKLNKK